jgi:hypothetical protein
MWAVDVYNEVVGSQQHLATAAGTNTRTTLAYSAHRVIISRCSWSRVHTMCNTHTHTHTFSHTHTHTHARTHRKRAPSRTHHNRMSPSRLLVTTMLPS